MPLQLKTFFQSSIFRRPETTYDSLSGLDVLLQTYRDMATISEPNASEKKPWTAALRWSGRKPVSDFVRDTELPMEIWLQILSFLSPGELVRLSRVSLKWRASCLDGQLWQNLSVRDGCASISATTLQHIISSSDIFIRNLDLGRALPKIYRQLGHSFMHICPNLTRVCFKNWQCHEKALWCFFKGHTQLVHIDISEINTVTDVVLETISQYCPKLQCLDISSCENVGSEGLLSIASRCRLIQLHAKRLYAWADLRILDALFKKNDLECLDVSCSQTFDDRALGTLMIGTEAGEMATPPRKLKQLSLAYCHSITDTGIMSCVERVPDLEELDLSHLIRLTDRSLCPLLRTIPKICKLNFKKLHHMTDGALLVLSQSRGRQTISHIDISYCFSIHDEGMLLFVKDCPMLHKICMCNTELSDAILIAMVSAVKMRDTRTASLHDKAAIDLHAVIDNCSNITWVGIAEVLLGNSHVLYKNSTIGVSKWSRSGRHKTYPTKLVRLSHLEILRKNLTLVKKGEFSRANELRLLWCEYKRLEAEAEAPGKGYEDRKRRAKQAWSEYKAVERYTFRKIQKTTVAFSHQK